MGSREFWNPAHPPADVDRIWPQYAENLSCVPKRETRRTVNERTPTRDSGDTARSPQRPRREGQKELEQHVA